LKRRDDATYLLSTVQYQNGIFKVFKIVAYRHLKDVLAAPRPQQSWKPKIAEIPPRDKKEPRRTLPRSMQKPPNQAPPRTKETPAKTAFELAFERAITGRGDA
jgi:hypothetical protein